MILTVGDISHALPLPVRGEILMITQHTGNVFSCFPLEKMFALHCNDCFSGINQYWEDVKCVIIIIRSVNTNN